MEAKLIRFDLVDSSKSEKEGIGIDDGTFMPLMISLIESSYLTTISFQGKLYRLVKTYVTLTLL